MGREGKLWGWSGIDSSNGPRRDAGPYHIEVVLSRRRHCHCHRGRLLPARTHAQKGVPDGLGRQEVEESVLGATPTPVEVKRTSFGFSFSANGDHSSTTPSTYRCRTYVTDQQLRGPREVIFNVFAVSGRPGDLMSMIVCGLLWRGVVIGPKDPCGVACLRSWGPGLRRRRVVLTLSCLCDW